MTDNATPATASPNNLVGVAILAGFLAAGAGLAAAASPATLGPLTFAFVFLGWILAVMAHEFGHALTAYLAGDHTVRDKGYLSFDPRRYGDVGTSLVIPLIALALGGIGFPGGAVYLRHDLMRSPGWRAAASLAGPGATLVMLILLALLSRLGWPAPLGDAVALLAFLQATALILNLLPIPGLDGFGAIRPFLPKSWNPALHKAEGVSMILLIAALLLVPGFGGAFFGFAADIAEAFGVSRLAVVQGFDAFQFWR
ncbi:site-2 protease family protein [Phenylobacterium sp.]|uniref:site-2 protease family protein n=1 Tax=Phenylobacterium sp. TaxID=1871053 RepID=UPI0028124862|nr:site-2 protease family protein [Phenylobacterium sp.]